MKRYAFANILLSGPCNLRCPDCIGHTLKQRAFPRNLEQFPLHGLETFTQELIRFGIHQVSLTGTNTEPQLYRHETALIRYLRRRVPGVRISLHTNGTMALKKMAVFNRYDRAAISFPSFDPDTCRAMTGSPAVRDLAKILDRAAIPVKISTLVTPHNRDEIPAMIARLRNLGVRRMVLRKRYGKTAPLAFFPETAPKRWFGGNPVYDIDGMEVTLWNFERSRLDCLNLFSDGTVTHQYDIAKAAA